AARGTGRALPPAFSPLATTLSPVGPGLGDIGSHFKNLPKEALWICNFSMRAGSR
ncbi:potassium transporter, partial [Francisella tularensis subsp. holarctica]|nr:potassium transporter [Francisella tularensis subsp. holarctica]